MGRLTSSPENPITARELLLSGCIHDAHDGIKLLGDVRTASNLYLVFSLNCVVACFHPQVQDIHHTFPRLQECSPCYRGGRGLGCVPLLQRPGPSRLLEGPHRPRLGSPYRPEGYP
jgi:hypothetical protein